MANNLGTYVSRVLDEKGRNYTNVVFQQKRPPLDSEWNLVQDINNSHHATMIKQMTPSGFLKIQDIKTAPTVRADLTSSWVNTIIINNPVAVVNGWIINVGGGTNQFQSNAQNNIWTELSNNEDEVAIIGEAAPSIGYREDLVFLEVWQKLIETDDTVPKHGFVQSALENNENDLIDPNIEIETSKRIQIQYRIRWVEGVDFISYRNGLGHAACFAKGPLGDENTSYTFSKHATDPGLWVAGDGTSQSQQDLETVDGYIYAIPIARIHRRNKQTYSLTNQNGAKISLLSGNLSERPDGLYYDEISEIDVEDLRHKVSLTGFDPNQLLEENIFKVWDRTLPSELKYSELDDNLAANKLIQVDGISLTTRSGVNDEGRDPDGVRRVFSEAEDTQIHTLTVAGGPTMASGKVWFCPIGQFTSCEYELWNEDIYYISGDVEPVVKVYDESTDVLTTISGGTWTGLGIKPTWDYLTGTKSVITYTPTDVLLIEGKNLVFEFTFVVREGGGLTGANGGFTHHIDEMLIAYNDNDGKPIDFNYYKDISSTVSLNPYLSTTSATTTGPRVVGSYTDSGLATSISRFEIATNPANTFKEIYKAATMELKYYVLSTGSTEDFIDITLYERTVFGILQVYNATTTQYISPSIEKQATGYKVTGLTVNTGDIIEYTLLTGGYTVDYVPHNRGIRNIAKVYNFTDSVQLGATEGVLNLNAKNSLCDAVLATTGFYDGSQYRHTAYINGKMVFIESVEGLGSAVVKYTLAEPSTVSGSITISFLGYYNPSSSDQFYFQYKYKPYAGIAATRLGEDEVQQVKILKMDDKIFVTTAGTGSESQYVPKELMGLIETLPINKSVLEYNFFGDNVVSPLTGGTSSCRRIPGRGLVSTTEGETCLKEGQIIDLMLGNEDDETDMKRGVIISSPKISERGIDFDTAFNHVNQWTALVEGMGNLKGELFLMVITTTSTKYNADESPDDEYLEQKGIYSDNALGKGKEIELNNNLESVQLTQNLGNKIYGAVDLFPLKYRPLVVPSEPDSE